MSMAYCCPAGAPVAQATISTQDASPCSTGQVQYVPPPALGPCCVCSPGTQNPAPGAACQQCSTAYTEPNTERNGCACIAGWSRITSAVTGKLQQCVQNGLSCRSTPHHDSVVNIVGNGCACSAGYIAQYDSTGKLVACQIPDDAPGPQATVPSGMRTNITMPSSSGPLLSVGNCTNGGRATTVMGDDDKDLISFVSR